MPNPIINRRLSSSPGVTGSITSAATGVDGLFQANISLSAPAVLSVSDFLVTNGTAEYVRTINNSNYIAYINPNAGGTVSTSLPVYKSNVVSTTIDSSWKFLSTPSQTFMFYDFRELAGLNGIAIPLTDLGMKDLSGNNRNLSLVNAPVANNTTGITNFRDLTNTCVSTQVTGSTFLNNDFVTMFQIKCTDGRSAVVQHICGNRDATNTGLVINIQTTGTMRISYQGFVWDSTAAVFPNGGTSISSFLIKFDFTNDILTVLQDGASVAGSFTTSSIAATNPASYNCTANLYVASINANGTPASNTDAISLYYFVITAVQANNTSIPAYLNARKPVFELVSTLTDASFLKVPHDVLVSVDMTVAYLSGKGDNVLTTVDGSFGIVGITNPASPSLLSGYSGHSDQLDGETVIIMSPTRVIHFSRSNALLFDTSNPAATALLRTVSYTTGVINGARQIGNYVFGANKDGYINVFDVTSIDTFTLFGTYNTNTVDGMIGPHDIHVSADGLNLIICCKTTGAQFAIYKVFSSPGVLIPVASWTRRSFISSTSNPDLTNANRVRVVGNTAMVYGTGLTVIDITNLDSPASLNQFLISGSTSTGASTYRGKYSIVANDIGVLLLDTFTTPASVKQIGGYTNNTTFTVSGSNTNFHDIDWFSNGGNNYCIVSSHLNGLAIFKINRV